MMIESEDEERVFETCISERWSLLQ
jgi:hypothetical protein